MKKRKLTSEELEKLQRLKEQKQAEKDSILFDTEALTPKQAKKINREKEKEILELVGGGQTSIYTRKQFSKMLLKRPDLDRGKTFVDEFYDQLYRLTGLKKNKKQPHEKPHVFAGYTVKYIYGLFKIKNLMDELRTRNPFLTAEMFREFKHYHFLNEENYYKLIGFINNAIEFMKGCKPKAMHEFDVKYCKHFGIKTDQDLFYKGD